jgi:ABC-2 type transport system permease protein
MLKALLKTRLLILWKSLFSRMKRGSANRGAGMKIAIGLLAVYILASLFFTVGSMFSLFAEPLLEMGLVWMYFAIAGLMCIAISVVGSIFAAQSYIFEAKDNELLLSMPIPVSYILASRLITLLILEYMFVALIMLPAAVVFFMHTTFTLVHLVMLLIASILIPFLSLTIASIFGWIVALVASKTRRKSLISIVLMLGLLGFYFYINMNLQKYIARLIENGTEIAESIRRGFPPAYYFGAAIGNTDLPSLGMLVLWCLIPFGAMYFILSKSFMMIVTMKKTAFKVEYKEKEMKEGTVRSALVKKELSRFFTLPAYMLNCGLGAVITLILAGALIIKGPGIISAVVAYDALSGYAPHILCAILCGLAAMTNTTAASISLEGKNLWILKSNPVRPKDVFSAKAMANLIIGVPAIVITALVSWFVMPMSPFQAIVILVLPITVQVFSALWGLAANLWFPQFNWINETAVIKQSVGSLVGMLGALAIVVLPVILYAAVLVNVLSADSYMILCVFFFTAASFVLFEYLNKAGERLFLRLGEENNRIRR